MSTVAAKVLSPSHALERLHRVHRCTDPIERRRERDELIEQMLPLADRLARQFYYCAEPLDDLKQVARLGLVKAVDGFDVDRPTPFLSYAIPTITGELKRYFRDKGWTIRVPRRMQEQRLRVRATRDLLTQEFGRTPTAAEIADRCDLTLDLVLGAQQIDNLYSPISLNAPVKSVRGDGDLTECVGAGDSDLDAVEDRDYLKKLLRDISDRSRYILYLRYFHNLTQEQIAHKTGLSQMQICRLLRQALADMNRSIGGENNN